MGKRTAAIGFAIGLLMAATPGRATAQQFVVDDADLVERGACQLEVWRGRSESWLEPACGVLHNLEVKAGAGPEYTLQLKTRLLDPDASRIAVGVALAVAVDALRPAVGQRAAALSVVIPATLALAGQRVRLHGNVGWELDRSPDSAPGRSGGVHSAAAGARADLVLHPRVEAMGEVTTGGSDPSRYQVGLRLDLLPGFLTADLSRAMARSPDGGPGWGLGLALTPWPFR